MIVTSMTSDRKMANFRHVCDSLWKQAIYHSLTKKIAMVFSDSKVTLLEDNNKNTIRSRFLRFLQDNYICRYLTVCHFDLLYLCYIHVALFS